MNDNDHASDSAADSHDAPPAQPAPSEPVNQAAAPAAPAPAATPTAPDDQHFFVADANASAPPLQSSVVVPAAAPQAAGPLDVRMEDNSQGVSWTASEFIAHQKPPEWYMAVGIVTVALATIIYFMGHDAFGVGITIVVGILFGVAASRQPRQIQYAVDGRGVHMGRHFYSYGNFRSFTVATEGPFRSVVLMPLKRFMPVLSMYIDPSDEDRIGDILSEHLPVHEHRETATDRLMRRIRF